MIPPAGPAFTPANVVSHGVDLVDCARIRRMLETHGDRFLERVFTRAERDYCMELRTPHIRLSGRFAVKEAVMKALGTGWRAGVEWTDIETLNDHNGKPHVCVAGRSAEIAAALGISHFLVSISHAGDYAIASAIAVGPPA